MGYAIDANILAEFLKTSSIVAIKTDRKTSQTVAK